MPVGSTNDLDISQRGTSNLAQSVAARLMSGLFYVEMAQTVSKDRNR